MTRLISSELLKLRSTRTTLALIGSVVGLVVLIALLAALSTRPEDFGTEVSPRDLLGIPGFADAFALVLGVLAVTSEFRHGTITPTLIVAPDRVRLVLAKVAANLLGGLLLGLLAVGLGMGIVLVALSARDIETGLTSGDVAGIAIGHVLGVALWAALGVGVGALIGNQVGAIVGALAWTFLGENLLTIIPTVGDEIRKYGLNGATNALGDLETAQTGDLLSQLEGGLLLLAYAVAFLVAGTLALRRRDATS